jgi:hypothetical protein
LAILDTKDPETLNKKKLVHVLMLTTLEERTRAESDPTTAFMHNFYRGLIGIISPVAGSGGEQTSAPPASPMEEATNFAASDADYRVRHTLPEAVPAAATSSPPKINDASGEAVQPGPASGWDYDVFWCVRNTQPGEPSKNLDIAKVFFNGLVKRQPSGKIGRVRLRRLPEVINQTAGFNVTNTAIVIRRYDSASEPKEAGELKRWVEEDLSSAHMGDEDSKVVIEDRPQKLRFYLTIFACTH